MNALIVPVAAAVRRRQTASPAPVGGARPSRRHGTMARNVLACGGPPPLCSRPPAGAPFQSARGRAQSKTWPVLVALGLLVGALSGNARAQTLSIPWHTMDAGGGTSTGGGFTVRGTVGQPDAGRMSGGGFTVTGGFWAWPQVIQTPGAPTLVIAQSAPGQAVVSWAAAPGGWLLQEAAALNGPWTPVPGGSTSPVTVPASFPARFYRLSKP